MIALNAIFVTIAILAAVARGDDGWTLPWTNLYWDFTPNATVYQNARTKVTVNSVVHTDQHLKLHIPAIDKPVATIVVNATALPPSETLTVLVIADAPDGKVIDTIVTFGGVFKPSDNVVFVPGQWVFFNVSSTVSTFFGQTVELSVNFIQFDGDVPSSSSSDSGRKRRHHAVGAIVGGTVGGLALLVAIVTCCVCAARKRRRCRLQRMAVTPSAPTSGEPSMYLPPAYRV